MEVKSCKTCKDETRREALFAGPGVFKKDSKRIVCKRYDCECFTDANLYPGDAMPKPADEPRDDEKAVEAKKAARTSARTKKPRKKDEA